MQSTLGIFPLGYIPTLEALLTKNYKIVKLILDGYPPPLDHTLHVHGAGVWWVQIIKRYILFLFYKSTEMIT